MDQKLTRGERRSLALREQIYSAAIELFMRQDFNAATMLDVANAADVARSTLFNHFPTKLDFLREFYLRFTRRAVEQARAAAAPRVDDRLRAIARAFGGSAGEFKPIVHHLASLAMGHGPLAATESEADMLLIGYFVETVSDGQADGTLRVDRDARTLADLLLGLLTVTAHDWVNLGIQGDLGALINDRFTLATTGLARR